MKSVSCFSKVNPSLLARAFSTGNYKWLTEENVDKIFRKVYSWSNQDIYPIEYIYLKSKRIVKEDDSTIRSEVLKIVQELRPAILYSDNKFYLEDLKWGEGYYMWTTKTGSSLKLLALMEEAKLIKKPDLMKDRNPVIHVNDGRLVRFLN